MTEKGKKLLQEYLRVMPDYCSHPIENGECGSCLGTFVDWFIAKGYQINEVYFLR